MTIISRDAANQIDLVDYLASLGFQPDKVRLPDYWYLSPFRNERTASFKVQRSKNVWYDHGEGIGGHLIDFGVRYHRCQIPEFLARLSSEFPAQQPVMAPSPKASAQVTNPITILDVCPIHSLDLFHYLKTRRIDFQTANTYCHQIVFKLANKTGRALGFLNDRGGYELRSSSFKGTVAPKATTLLRQGIQELLVFEGFFDFLSYQSIHKNISAARSDFLILNSTAFFEKSRPQMEDYESVRLFLDHDATGEKCTKLGLSWGKKYQDESGLYQGHKDFNEWIQSIGKAQNLSKLPKLR